MNYLLITANQPGSYTLAQTGGYPNPAGENITVVFQSDHAQLLEFLDVSGRKVLSHPVQSGEQLNV